MPYAWRTMRNRGERVASLWRIILTCNMLTAFLPGLTLVHVFIVLQVKYTLNLSVPIAYQAIKLRWRYVPAALLSIALRTCSGGVRMVNRSCYALAAIFTTQFKKIAAFLRSCSVSATEAFDAVAFLAITDTPYVCKPIRKSVRSV